MKKTQLKTTKDLMAAACIGMAVIGLSLGMMIPEPIANAFSGGTIICFIAFLLSLGSVKDRGNNFPALLAFMISFLAMAVSIFRSGLLS